MLKWEESPMGLGLAALGRPGYISLNHADDLNRNYAPEAMQTHAHSVLDAAWAAGIRYFDAARSYGRAEEFLGSWLRTRAIDPSAVRVGSKWGYTYTADWQVEANVHEIKDHTIGVLQRQWRETQTALGGYLDLYQIHSATLDSGVLEDTAVLSELARLKNDGLAVGISLSGANQAQTLARALTIRMEGSPLFDAVQVTWNLLEISTSAVLNEAHDAGMHVIVKEAVANGRLTPRNVSPAFAEKRALLEQQAARLGTTIDALCIAAALAQPWATIVLSGAATVEQLQSNITARTVAWDAEAAEALASLAEPPAEYWETRKKLAWN